VCSFSSERGTSGCNGTGPCSGKLGGPGLTRRCSSRWTAGATGSDFTSGDVSDVSTGAPGGDFTGSDVSDVSTGAPGGEFTGGDVSDVSTGAPGGEFTGGDVSDVSTGQPRGSFTDGDVSDVSTEFLLWLLGVGECACCETSTRWSLAGGTCPGGGCMAACDIDRAGQGFEGGDFTDGDACWIGGAGRLSEAGDFTGGDP